MAKASPFTGLRLSEQVSSPAAGLDQQLFTSTSVVKSPARPEDVNAETTPMLRKSTKETRLQGTKEATLEARKEGTLEPRNQGKTAESVLGSYTFDINKRGYRQNTYAFTDDELEALEDLSIHLRRKLAVDATKNDLVRCAIHGLVDDFKKHGDDSAVVHKLRRKLPR
jgi:hypothetical protein